MAAVAKAPPRTSSLQSARQTAVAHELERMNAQLRLDARAVTRLATNQNANNTIAAHMTNTQRRRLWTRVLQKNSNASLLWLSLLDAECRDAKLIASDIARMPTLASSLRDSLYKVLHAYAVMDAECGYCQGLSFVAAPLLVAGLDPELAFHALCVLMMDQSSTSSSSASSASSTICHGLRSLFTPEMPGLHLILHQLSRLIKSHIPLVHARLTFLNISPTMYAASWFLTLFSYAFPTRLVLRIYDLIFLGPDRAVVVLLRIALALLKRNEPILIKSATPIPSPTPAQSLLDPKTLQQSPIITTAITAAPPLESLQTPSIPHQHGDTTNHPRSISPSRLFFKWPLFSNSLYPSNLQQSANKDSFTYNQSAMDFEQVMEILRGDGILNVYRRRNKESSSGDGVKWDRGGLERSNRDATFEGKKDEAVEFGSRKDSGSDGSNGVADGAGGGSSGICCDVAKGGGSSDKNRGDAFVIVNGGSLSVSQTLTDSVISKASEEDTSDCYQEATEQVDEEVIAQLGDSANTENELDHENQQKGNKNAADDEKETEEEDDVDIDLLFSDMHVFDTVVTDSVLLDLSNSYFKDKEISASNLLEITTLRTSIATLTSENESLQKDNEALKVALRQMHSEHVVDLEEIQRKCNARVFAAEERVRALKGRLREVSEKVYE